MDKARVDPLTTVARMGGKEDARWEGLLLLFTNAGDTMGEAICWAGGRRVTGEDCGPSGSSIACCVAGKDYSISKSQLLPTEDCGIA